jgi:hypothetical protein
MNHELIFDIAVIVSILVLLLQISILSKKVKSLEEKLKK